MLGSGGETSVKSGDPEAEVEDASAGTATTDESRDASGTASESSSSASDSDFPGMLRLPPDLEELRADIADGFSAAADKVRSEVRKLQAKTRAATHPPLPVVGTFDELLRFAKIASLNAAPEDEIRGFFAATNEDVTVLDMESVKQRVLIATDHERRLHTVSFRGTTNLTNVVQNIRLSSNPVRASGRLASVGRSLSGAFAGLRDRRGNAAEDADGGGGSGSGSFDEDDPDQCDDLDWNASPEEIARRGCTDHLPMHRGYRLVARECRDALAPHVRPGYAVQLTGHSLGGAVAVAVALLYRASGVDVTKVVTFGAPKLGPRETRDAAAELSVLRVVQKDDIIPLLPMSRPFVRKPYVHLGEGIMLDNDAPGRYAPLAKEWGVAGILWRQRAHLGYAAGADARGADAGSADAGGADVGADMGADVGADVATVRASRDVLVSADDADDLDDARGAVRRGRFYAARRRLANLRAALREGVAARRLLGGGNANANRNGNGIGNGAGSNSVSNGVASNGPVAVAALAGVPTPSFAGVSSSGDAEWAQEVAAWANAPHETGGTDIAPFDDVEGELFVSLAETEGGAAEAAAAAATEWERATSRDGEAGGNGVAPAAAARSSPTGTGTGSVVSGSVVPESVVSGTAGGDANANLREGPTIFQTLWKLRSMDAESRMEKLECHRMRRYVAAVEAAMAAGPVQTSIAGVYSGEVEDDVGLDMSGGDDDEDDAGGVSSWMTWSR